MIAGQLVVAAAKDAAPVEIFEIIVLIKGPRKAKILAPPFLDVVSIYRNSATRFDLNTPVFCTTPQKCDKCGVPFSMVHKLSCKYGGLVILRHNGMCREIIHHAVQTLLGSSI